MSDTRFKKEMTPWNKGIKVGLIPHSAFKKGNIPWNTREIFTERVNKAGYTEIKIEEPKKWEKKHRWIWRQKYGEIPKGSVIIFADGNKSNFDINNLICVTRNELKVLNKCRLISSDPELTKTGLNVAKIRIKLAELRKEKKN